MGRLVDLSRRFVILDGKGLYPEAFEKDNFVVVYTWGRGQPATRHCASP